MTDAITEAAQKALADESRDAASSLEDLIDPNAIYDAAGTEA